MSAPFSVPRRRSHGDRARRAVTRATSRHPVLADLAALGLLAVTVLVFFWPVVFGGLWLPQGGGDLASFLFPMYRFVASSLREGVLPLWNPHQYAGAPLVADNQSGLFYPPNLLLFLAWPRFPYAALEALVMIHVWWAGAAMYLLLRLWRPADPMGRAASVFGAIGFMLGDVFLTHLGNLNLNAVLSWLPLALLGLHRAIDARDRAERLRWSIAGGLALGVGALAGHGQATFLTVFYLLVYAAFRAAVDRRPSSLAPLVGVVAIGAGLAAIAALPAVAVAPHTARASLSASEATRYSLDPVALVGLAAPGFFGRGAAAFWGWWDRVEVGYVGVLPWLLAIVAVARVPRRVAFPLFASALCLVIALGPHTPVYSHVIAPLGLPFRAPARFAVLFDLGLMMIAAEGFDVLVRERRTRSSLVPAIALGGAIAITLVLASAAIAQGATHPDRWPQMAQALAAWAALAAVGLGLVWLRDAGRLAPSRFAALAIGLLVVDLVALGSRVEVDPHDPTLGFRFAPAARFLTDRAGLDRIAAAGGPWQPGAAQMLGLLAADGVYNPLRLGIYGYYMDGLRNVGSKPYDLLGVRYIVAAKGQAPSGEPDIRPAFTADPDVDVYENAGVMPRAMVVPHSRVIADEAAAYAALHDPGFDPRDTVILLEGVSRTGRGGGGRVEEISYAPNRVSLRVTADAPAWVVLTDVHAAGWRATMDGRPVPIRRADFAFRAVEVPPGRHEIVMSYVPPLWRTGIAVTLATVLAVVATAVAVRPRRYQGL